MRGRHEDAYVDLAASSRYVCVLFCGSLVDREGNRTAFPHRGQLFTWDGEFVRELELGAPVSRLAVSRNDSLLWAQDTSPYPLVGDWRLPASLRKSRSS